MASTPSSSHKPRKRPKGMRDASPLWPSTAHRQENNVDNLTPAFPLAAFLWPARGGVSSWAIVPLILMICGLFRWTTGLWEYSGYQAPPMHGDFEAQRHWMELTTHLPITNWYFHDLEWWGLDYPPLTAYHSWLLGTIGSSINPQWFALHTSRGLDDADLKTYMRATVMASEFLVYVPAVLIFIRRISRLQMVNKWEASVAIAAILMQPATILIDHAHFQYNTVMLGFVVATFSSALVGKLLWACVFFVAALGFKQMTLYYAPAVFAFLLGRCLQPRINLPQLLGIALVTALSFLLLFAPLVLGTMRDQWTGTSFSELTAPPILKSLPVENNVFFYPTLLEVAQSIHRIFPFARGLFEDKVANFWCALHVFHKLHRYSTALLQRLALGATVAAILPPSLAIGLYPDSAMLPIAAATTAWGFFLFSFQVHEKSVLLPLLPMTLLLAGEGGLGPETRAWISWANLLGSWTMFPLLKRDGLRIPYFVLTLLWAWLMGEPSIFSTVGNTTGQRPHRLTQAIHTVFYFTMGLWHLADAFVATPEGKPDLWVVANVLVGAAGFGMCYLWCLWNLLQACWQRSSWPREGRRTPKTVKTQ